MKTLNDIAKLAGVSKSTVSKVLNDSSEISERTKKKVREIAARLHYVNKAPGNGIVCSKTIGLIIPEIVNEFSLMSNTIIKDSSERGYTAIAGITGYDICRERHLFDFFANLKVGGMILLSLNRQSQEEDFDETILKTNIPLVQLGANTTGLFDNVSYDLDAEASLAVEHLYKLGHRNIGYIGEDMSFNRLESIKRAVGRYGLSMDERFVSYGSERFHEGGYKRAKEILKYKNLPTAFIASYDDMAVGAMKAFCEAGLRIPEDISIISFDDSSAAPYLPAPLTTIAEPADEWGSTAVQMLISKIENPSLKVIKNVMLKPVLIVRKTTAPVRS